MRMLGRLTRGIPFDRLMVGMLFAAFAVAVCFIPAQSDTFWHLRAGAEIWQTHRVSFDEHWSFTAAGRYWPNHEWLWQVISYAAVRAGGLPALSALGAAIVLGALLLTHGLMVGSGRERFVLLLMPIPLSMCVWALRPQLASLFLLMLVLRLLVRERYGWLPLVFVLWANLHGAVALGVVVLCTAAGAALWQARTGEPRARRRAAVLGLLVPVCVLATALTPMGFRLWSYIGTSMSLSKATGILEWQPVRAKDFLDIAFILTALALAALIVWRRRRLASLAWEDLVCLAAALVVAPLAFRAVRNIGPFLLLAVPAASRLLGSEFRFRFGRKSQISGVEPRLTGFDPGDRPRANLVIVVVSWVLALGVVFQSWRSHTPRLGWEPLGAEAIAAVRGCSGPTFNRYYDGGYLLWFVPERRVFVDNRQDPYPLDLLLEQQRAERGGPYRPLFDRYGIGCAFLSAGSPLGPRLAADGWQRRFADPSWTVLAAPTATPPR